MVTEAASTPPAAIQPGSIHQACATSRVRGAETPPDALAEPPPEAAASPTGVLPATSGLQNGFNAALALGVVRAAYHATGDAEIGRYYYDELVGARDLPALAAKFTGVVFVGAMTNYSNVNMLAIALATLGRFETDDYTLKKYGETLETQFWSAGSAYDADKICDPTSTRRYQNTESRASLSR